MSVGNVSAVVRFELKRALARTRMFWWALLAIFPVGITLLICSTPEYARHEPPREVWATIFFLLIPLAVCMLGTFLYAAPAVSAELEGKSWVYLAVRPHAPTAVLLGKYLVAIFWTASAAFAGLTLSMLIARPDDASQLWLALAGLIVLSCPAYAAVYLVLGTWFYKRAMISGIAYTLVFELLVSMIPALVNKLTIQFRLRALFVKWAEIDITQEDITMRQLLGESHPAVHVVVLIIYTILMLGLALFILRRSEFTIADEATT